jgi:hypothetical protein
MFAVCRQMDACGLGLCPESNPPGATHPQVFATVFDPL